MTNKANNAKNTPGQMLDSAKIKIRAGRGGDGRVSFRHEKYLAKGGPDGGDGGKGGSIYFTADTNLETLLDFRSKALLSAQDGEVGGKKNMTGKSGEDLFVKVPVGTLIYEERSTKLYDGASESLSTKAKVRVVLVADMNVEGKVFLAAKGGFGGRGNSKFKSSINQAPTQYTTGVTGEEKVIKLEVKLIADVGLIGFPNAGKSTLLNALTRSNAKVSSYPFTTLAPNLGVLRLTHGGEIIFADIPGLVEDASKGKGLGAEFLKHVERTRMLVHLIDPVNYAYTKEIDPAANSLKQYEIIRRELTSYSKDLPDTPEIIVINKTDITEVRQAFESIKKAFSSLGKDIIGVSGASRDGLEQFVNLLLDHLAKLPQKKTFEVQSEVRIFRISDLPNKRLVFNDTLRDWEGDKKIG